MPPVLVILWGLTKGHPDSCFHGHTIKRLFIFNDLALPAQGGVGLLCFGPPPWVFRVTTWLCWFSFLLWAWRMDHILSTDKFVLCLWGPLPDFF